MTLREHFEAIERKLDLLLTLMGERGSRDSLDWAGELTQTGELLAKARQRGRALASAAGDLACRVAASSSAPPPIRLLVEENGHKIWRTVQGKCLIGRASADGELSVMGRWAKATGGMGRDTDFDFYVIQTASNRYVIYKRPADSWWESSSCEIWQRWKLCCRPTSSPKLSRVFAWPIGAVRAIRSDRSKGSDAPM